MTVALDDAAETRHGKLTGVRSGTTEARAFLPPQVPAELLDSLNAFNVRRFPIRLEVEGVPLVVDFALADEASPSPTPTIAIPLRLGDEPAVFKAPRQAFELIVKGISPDSPGDDETLLMLAELALAPLLSVLETGLQRPILRDVLDTKVLAKPTYVIAMRVMLGDFAFDCSVTLGPALLQAAAGLWARRPVQRRSVGHLLTASLSVRIGSTCLSRDDLAQLAVGDAVLVDENLMDRGLVALALDGLGTIARSQPAGVALLTPLRPRSMFKDSPTMDENSLQMTPSGNTDLGSLQVTLVFEVGRKTVTLAELETLKAGTIFATDLDLAGPVNILANGAVIGAGELVRIGSRLGVKATRLFDRE